MFLIQLDAQSAGGDSVKASTGVGCYRGYEHTMSSGLVNGLRRRDSSYPVEEEPPMDMEVTAHTNTIRGDEAKDDSVRSQPQNNDCRTVALPSSVVNPEVVANHEDSSPTVSDLRHDDRVCSNTRSLKLS